MKPLPPPDDAVEHPEAVEVLRARIESSLLDHLAKPYPGLQGSIKPSGQ